MKTGIELIAQERKEQIEKHGWNDKNTIGLDQAAIFCLTRKTVDYPLHWNMWFLEKVIAKEKRMTDYDFQIEMLKIAGAFCAAEIDRLQLETK